MIVLALSVLLSFSDPPNDATGDGSLRLPTAPVYRSAGALDLTEFDLLEGEDLGFVLTFSSLGNPHNLPEGFSLPIVELYIEDKDGGAGVADLLPGGGMSLPEGETWHYAFQLSGDAVRVYGADASGGYEEISNSANPELNVEGSALRLETSLGLPENLNVYGMVGNYSAFSPTGWQALSQQTSPWAYSSATQRRPVVDVLALTPESQAQAIQQGVLPAIQTSRVTPPSYWVYVMLAGILLGMVGVAGRFMQPQLAQKARAARPQRRNPAYREPTAQALNTDVPDIDWEAPQLNQNISEVVAKTTLVREKPVTPKPDVLKPDVLKPDASSPEFPNPASKPGRDARPITFTPDNRPSEAATPEDSSPPPPSQRLNPNEVIDLRKLSKTEPKITRAQPTKPAPAKREGVSGSSFKIADFNLDEVIAQDDANVRTSVAEEAPKPTPAANLADKVIARPDSDRPTPTKPNADSVKVDKPRIDSATRSTRPTAPKTPEKSEPLRAPEPLKRDVTRPATHLKPETSPKPKPPVEPATYPKAAPPKPAPSKPAQQPDALSSKLLTDVPPRNEPSNASIPKLEAATPKDTQTVSFSAKPVKPEGKNPKAAELNTEDLAKKETTSSHDDNLEIYSLKQALKKLKPKDEPVSGDEDSSA